MAEEKDAPKVGTVGHLVLAVCKPPADVLGKELAGGAQFAIDHVKQWWRGRNLQSHVEKAVDCLRAMGLDEATMSPQQIGLFEDWCAGAAEIDADAGPLAELWQALFVSMAKGDSDVDILLEKAKKLKPRHIPFLLKDEVARKRRLFVFTPPEEGRQALALQQLKELGLMNTSDWRWRRRQVTLTLAGISVWACTIAYWLSSISKKAKSGTFPSFGFPSATTLAMVAGVLLFFLVVVDRRTHTEMWYPTWIGRALRESLKAYTTAKGSPATPPPTPPQSSPPH